MRSNQHEKGSIVKKIFILLLICISNTSLYAIGLSCEQERSIDAACSYNCKDEIGASKDACKNMCADQMSAYFEGQ